MSKKKKGSVPVAPPKQEKGTHRSGIQDWSTSDHQRQTS